MTRKGRIRNKHSGLKVTFILNLLLIPVRVFGVNNLLPVPVISVEPDPHPSEKLDADEHLSERLEPDPNKINVNEMDKLYSVLRVRDVKSRIRYRTIPVPSKIIKCLIFPYDPAPDVRKVTYARRTLPVQCTYSHCAVFGLYWYVVYEIFP
jgi:hypothetical protein